LATEPLIQNVQSRMQCVILQDISGGTSWMFLIIMKHYGQIMWLNDQSLFETYIQLVLSWDFFKSYRIVVWITEVHRLSELVLEPRRERQETSSIYPVSLYTCFSCLLLLHKLNIQGIFLYSLWFSFLELWVLSEYCSAMQWMAQVG